MDSYTIMHSAMLFQSRLLSPECLLLLVTAPERPKPWGSAHQRFFLSSSDPAAKVSYAVDKSWWIKSKATGKQRDNDIFVITYLHGAGKRPAEQTQMIARQPPRWQNLSAWQAQLHNFGINPSSFAATLFPSGEIIYQDGSTRNHL